MLAARIMQHIPERANQLTSSRNHFTLGAHHEGEESWPSGRGAHGRQRCLAIEPHHVRPVFRQWLTNLDRFNHHRWLDRCYWVRRNTMIFTIICVVGLVGSFVATAHAIWARGI